MSRKKAFIQAVAFAAPELSALWRASPAVPSSPRAPNPNQLAPMLLGIKQIAEALGFSGPTTLQLLRGTGQSGIQLRFDAFMERLSQAFEVKKKAFEESWSPSQPSKPAKKAKKAKVASTALAIPSENPSSLRDPTQAISDLTRKMGYDVFRNLTALARACGVARTTLARARDGYLVRKSTLDKISALGQLSTRTVVRKMRPPALQ